MAFLIRHFAPFWAMKRAIIKAALAGMSETGKAKILGEVIASTLPRYRIGLMPYQAHPEKKEANKQKRQQQTVMEVENG
jgi:hypothetical protein